MTEPDAANQPITDDAFSEDTLLNGQLRLRQPKRGYRAGIDALLLAAACPAQEGQQVFEPGCGVGTAALALCRRVAGVTVTGLERDALALQLAAHNAAANGLGDRFVAYRGEIAQPPADLLPDHFDHVILNPPFYPAGSYNPRGHARKRAAHAEDETTLADWFALARRMIRGRGSVTMVNRMARLPDTLAALGNGFGEARVIPLWPKPHRPAKLVLVTARKNIATPMEMLPGITLHSEDGDWTAEMQRVLAGQSLAQIMSGP